MTSRSERKARRENSLLGLLRQARAERAMSSPLDAARWRPDAYAESPWNEIIWPRRPWNEIVWPRQ